MLPLKDIIPSRTYPFVTVSIIVLNSFFFLIELLVPPPLREPMFYVVGLVPAYFSNFSFLAEYPFYVLSIFTSMFIHGSFLHLLSNMWMLWIFGDNVEDRLGHFRFFIFYILCGIAAAVVHIIFNLNSPVPTVGASGAIAGVMGAYFVMYPLSRIVVLVPIFIFPFFFELYAFVFILLWFWMQLSQGFISLMLPQGLGGIAWWAHIGGFIAGIFLLEILKPRKEFRRKIYHDERVFEDAWF
ncbi:MAG: rhomboid family intramembrane serine protease [Candidatus Dadabacteria bacterium]|nr:MAG: rhomboid family intramembrane serine protease [Candidatus Dadabacteria bacterium]